MRYTVKGAKRDTGESTTLAVEASTAAEATAKANRHGLLVESCEPMGGNSGREERRSPDSKVPRTTSSAPKKMLLTGAIVIGMAIVAFAGLYYFKIKPDQIAMQRSLAESAKQMEQSAAKQREIDAVQTRRASIKARLIQNRSEASYLRLVDQLDFTDAAKALMQQASELHALSTQGTLSPEEHAHRLSEIEKSYGALKGQKLRTTSRDWFDESMNAAIAKYREAQSALNSIDKHPEVSATYRSTVTAAWKQGGEKLMAAIFTYKEMLEEVEKP